MHKKRKICRGLHDRLQINTRRGLQKKKKKDGEKKSSPECKKIVGKIQFNPAIHSIKTQNNERSKKRFRKREKQKKEKREKRKERKLKKNRTIFKTTTTYCLITY